MKNARSQEHAVNTLKKSPGLYIGIPDDYSTTDMSLVEFEHESMNAVYAGDKEKSMFAAGESAQRINDMPKTADLVQIIMKEAEDTLKNLSKLVI